MILTLSRNKTFIPDCWDNKSQAEPVKATIRIMTTLEAEELLGSLSGGTVKDSDIFVKFTEKIENLAADIDGELVELTDPKAVVEAPAMLPLVREVAKEIVFNGYLDSSSKKEPSPSIP